MKIWIQGGWIVTMDSEESIVHGDVLIEDGRIAAVGTVAPPPGSGADIVDAKGMAIIPGLIQTHIHSCQALFRGDADDLPLLDWLRERIWPLEAAHTSESLYLSALLGYAECLLSGTTTVLDMSTVHHTENVFRAAAESGIRAVIGKALMDTGAGVPGRLLEPTDAALEEWDDLHRRFHNAENGRLKSSLAPRFALSCSKRLLEQVAALAGERNVIVQTHASENRDECAAVRLSTGFGNVEYLHHVGLTGNHVVLAHCVFVSPLEMDILAKTGTIVAHCPSSNLKLASGLAPVNELLARRIPVTIGADGPPCNNNLDLFTEMRLTSLLQKVRHGAQAMPARRVFGLTTAGAASALGLSEVGSIVPGYRADIAVVDMSGCHQMLDPERDIYSALVYSAKSCDVRHVWVDGRQLVRNGKLTGIDIAPVRAEARIAAAAIRRQLQCIM